MMIKDIYQREGIQGFFRGFSSSLVVHIFYSFQWWFSYSQMRHLLTPLKLSPVAFDAVTGCFAGVFSSILSHPLDTVKLRIQTGVYPDSDMIKAFGSILKDEGVTGLFNGVSANIYASAFSSAAFCITCKGATSYLIITFLFNYYPFYCADEIIKRAAKVDQPKSKDL